MSKVNIEVSFELRQKILAARKPYENFGQALMRILTEGAAAPTLNARTLTRKADRWPYPTPARLRARKLELFIADMRAAGFKDSDKQLEALCFDRYGKNDEAYTPKLRAALDARRNDPANWHHPNDVDLDTVIVKVMETLRARKAKTPFRFYDLVHKACPKIHRIGGAPTDELMASLLNMPQFMRSVQRVEGGGYFGLKLKKV